MNTKNNNMKANHLLILMLGVFGGMLYFYTRITLIFSAIFAVIFILLALFNKKSDEGDIYLKEYLKRKKK